MDNITGTHFQAAEDGLYQAREAGRAIKMLLNEYRDSHLTKEEFLAVLDANDD